MYSCQNRQVCWLEHKDFMNELKSLEKSDRVVVKVSQMCSRNSSRLVSLVSVARLLARVLALECTS